MYPAKDAPYRLRSLLGSGGHGEVFEVSCTQTGALFALKVIRPELANQHAFVKALRKEWRILMSLSHPNVIQVHDLTDLDGLPALVMERLRGFDLKRWQSVNGTFSVDAAILILEQLLDGLAYIHAQGVIHRDIKPANVFLTEDRRVVLTDFGVARAVDETVSTTNRMKGSLGYMAPERFRGEVTPAGDLYAAGLVAWELLSGQVACPVGDLPTRMHWHMFIGPPDPRVARPETPTWLGRFLAVLLSPDPSRRPQSGAEALVLLRRMQMADPTVTRTISESLNTPLAPIPAISDPQPTPPRQRPLFARPDGLSFALLVTLVLLGIAVRLNFSLIFGLGGLTVVGMLVLQQGRGTPWAILWTVWIAALTQLMLTAHPTSWILMAIAGLLSWIGFLRMRPKRWPLFVSEIAIYLLGLTVLCAIFWAGFMSLLT